MKNLKGYTLTELLVAITLSTIFIASIALLLSQTIKINQRSQELSNVTMQLEYIEEYVYQKYTLGDSLNLDADGNVRHNDKVISDNYNNFIQKIEINSVADKTNIIISYRLNNNIKTLSLVVF